jgi:DNA-binding winged helix-turn-helix (wHTH) protein
MRDARRSKIVGFGPFQLDLTAGELCVDGQRIRLQEQPFQLLKMLIERPGEVVTRDEIRQRLWPSGTVVEFDHSINAAIKKLRGALGDSAEQPRYVETVARRGYRFVAPVERREGTQGSAESEVVESHAEEALAAPKACDYPLLGIRSSAVQPSTSDARGSWLRPRLYVPIAVVLAAGIWFVLFRRSDPSFSRDANEAVFSRRGLKPRPPPRVLADHTGYFP